MVKVAEIAVYDYGSGLAEIRNETKDSLLIRWITFCPCYQSQVYSKSIYMETTELEKSEIYEISDISEMREEEVNRKRKNSLQNDLSIFRKYRELRKESEYNSILQQNFYRN